MAAVVTPRLRFRQPRSADQRVHTTAVIVSRKSQVAGRDRQRRDTRWRDGDAPLYGVRNITPGGIPPRE